jgi:hypothetical protein
MRPGTADPHGLHRRPPRVTPPASTGYTAPEALLLAAAPLSSSRSSASVRWRQ